VKLVIGLGNPGKEYEHTPHNAGFEAIDVLAVRCGCALRRSLRFKAHLAHVKIGNEKVILAKPRVYMNLSCRVVGEIAGKTGTAGEDLIIMSDDSDLPLGAIRIRFGGGDGGHRGLLSVIEGLGSDRFARIRMGTGRRADRDLTSHVLTPFPAETRATIEKMLAEAADAVEHLAINGLESAMNKFNARTKNGVWQTGGENIEKI